jgi:hypothetical protein
MVSNDDEIYDLRSKHHFDFYLGISLTRFIMAYPVIGAAELSPTKRNHLPNSFVQVSLLGFKYETEVVKRSSEPHWNELTRL